MPSTNPAAPYRRRRIAHRKLVEVLRQRWRTPRPGPRVLLAGKLAGMSAPGGGEVQLLSTARALGALGVRAQLWRPWEQRLAGAQVLHLFGSEREHLPVVAAARRQRLPVVLSTIAWFDWTSVFHQPGTIGRRLLATGRFAARAAAPWISTWRRQLYHACDLLLPNSEAEAEQLVRYFGVERQRIHVVPNGADPRFAAADPALFVRRTGLSNFVLYSGRIEPRKNQLGFLRAMRGTGARVVMLGDPVPGHEGYFAACQREAGPNVTFLPRRDHDDPLLASAYAACGCLVLASWFETPGLVALEAGMSGVPLVLPRGGCAREYFRAFADYVSPNRPVEIRDAVLAALERPRSAALARHVNERYSWRAAAEATREAYARLL